MFTAKVPNRWVAFTSKGRNTFDHAYGPSGLADLNSTLGQGLALDTHISGHRAVGVLCGDVMVVDYSSRLHREGRLKILVCTHFTRSHYNNEKEEEEYFVRGLNRTCKLRMFFCFFFLLLSGRRNK